MKCTETQESVKQEQRKNAKLQMLTFSTGSFMAAPPYLITIVLFRNCCRYGNASDNTDTLSNGEKFFEICKQCRHSCVLTQLPVMQVI